MKHLPIVTLKKEFVTLFLLFILFSGRNRISGQEIDKDSIYSGNTYTKVTDASARITFINSGGKELMFASPKPFLFLRRIPYDLGHIAKAPFTKKGLVWLAITSVSSVGLILYDQKITNWINKVSRSVGIGPNTSYDVLIKTGNTKVLELPRNGMTAFYQLGQGATSLMLAGGIWVYGKFSHEYRSAATASDLAEAFATVAITTQIVKRLSGRESPFESSAPGGRWRPFPSFRKFQNDTPKYDAFPSGHLATLMATVTVLSDNYPEKKWIKPIGYSLMGICMWTMANIEVHWVGDYPLALALGYLSGKITEMQHRKKPAIKTVLF